MAYVNPITKKVNLMAAERHVKQNFDSAYHILWRIGCDTGYRVTDLTELTWSNINLKNRTITIAENKGTKSAAARARLKVLSQVKNELIAMNSNDSKAMMQVFITPPKDVYSLIPESMRPLVDIRIHDAMAKAPKKMRTAKISDETARLLKQRKSANEKIDSGNVFSRRTLKSNRAINCDGVISRQSCWRVFSSLTSLMQSLGENIKVGCHSMRKCFARYLYESSKSNIALVMATIGHSSQAMTLKYIGISNDEALSAQDNLFNYMAA